MFTTSFKFLISFWCCGPLVVAEGLWVGEERNHSLLCTVQYCTVSRPGPPSSIIPCPAARARVGRNTQSKNNMKTFSL